MLNSRILGVIWRAKIYFVQNSTTIFLPSNTRRTTSVLPDAGEPWLAKNKKLGAAKCLQSDLVLWIINLFSWILYAVPTEKSCRTTMSKTLPSGLYSFSCLLYPDWHIVNFWHARRMPGIVYLQTCLSSKSNNYILYGNSPACGDWVGLLLYTLKSVTLMEQNIPMRAKSKEFFNICCQ